MTSLITPVVILFSAACFQEDEEVKLLLWAAGIVLSIVVMIMCNLEHKED